MLADQRKADSRQVADYRSLDQAARVPARENNPQRYFPPPCLSEGMNMPRGAHGLYGACPVGHHGN